MKRPDRRPQGNTRKPVAPKAEPRPVTVIKPATGAKQSVAASRGSEGRTATNQQLKQERQRLGALRQRRGASPAANEVARFRAYSRRKKILWASIISPFVALILLVVATLTTPLLAINSSRVEGTQRLKKVSIQNALKPEIGTPLTLVDSASIANALSSFSLIESFAAIAQPPHTLVIRITERQPICIVTMNGVDYLYDPAGVQIGVAKSSDVYPVVSIGGDPKSDAHFKQAMDVLLALPVKLLPRVALVQARTKDDVRLQLRGSSGQTIIWGDGSNSVLKSKVLSALLKHVKQSVSATIDVSSPTAPVVRY